MVFVGDYFAIGLVLVLFLFYFDGSTRPRYMPVDSKYFIACLFFTAASALVDIVAGILLDTPGVPLWLDMSVNTLYFLANIVTTGLVSLLVEEDYNGAVAHSVCYGLSTIPHVEEEQLHGDLVAYGVLVQLMLDGDIEEAKRLRAFLRSIGTPTCLADFGLGSADSLPDQVIEVTLAGDDMRHLPYPVTASMLRTAIAAVETL